MKIPLDVLLELPRDQFYVISKGKLVQDLTTLNEDDNFHVCPRVLGGKGGFGSLLRSFGSQFYKSTNQDMCRDLSGRRLKDVKEEERLKKYIAKASEREKEKQRKIEEKYKKLKQLEERKHEFKDLDYSRQKQQILDETEEALQQGLKAISNGGKSAESTSSDAPGPSGLGKRKRDSDQESTSGSSSDEQKPKKQMTKIDAAWLGIDGLDEADLESSDSETEPTTSNKTVSIKAIEKDK